MSDNVEIDVEEAAANACALLLPEKSKDRYKFIYSKFKEWQEVKHLNIVDEKALLAYFFERSQHLKSPASLWSEYSMLKTTLSINDSIDISKFLKLRAFLKRRNDGYKPKKSNVFSRQEMKTFLKEAPDSQYLLMKVRYIALELFRNTVTYWIFDFFRYFVGSCTRWHRWSMP